MGAKSILRLRWYEIVVALLVIISLGVLYFRPRGWFNPSAARKVYTTKRSLAIIRSEILKYKDITGEYPNSLHDLCESVSQNTSEACIGPHIIAERISDSNGNSREYNELNGDGGWYYDKMTGTVKVNIKNPVRQYIRSYMGSVGQEVPCDW